MPLAAAPPGVRVDVRGDRASDEEVHLLLPRHADVRMRVEVAVQGGRSALHRADHDHGGQGSGHGLRDTRGTDRHSRATAGRPRRVAAHGGGYLTSGSPNRPEAPVDPLPDLAEALAAAARSMGGERTLDETLAAIAHTAQRSIPG